MKQNKSCGIIITDGEKVLLCHVTGTKLWDIPKGKPEEGEDDLSAALRETYEETNLVLEDVKDRLIPLEQMPYNRRKDIVLYIYKTKNLPPIKDLKCHSFFNQGTTPEMDDYQYVDWKDIEDYVPASLYKVLEEIFEDVEAAEFIDAASTLNAVFWGFVLGIALVVGFGLYLLIQLAL